MESEMTLTIPQSLYQQVERIARARHQEITAVLAEALALIESGTEDAEEAQMAQEEVAYAAMYAELWEKYAGEYVAIYQGQLIDHDTTELALLRRLNAQYPNEVVLMKQVRPQPEPILHFRSPRLVRDIA
ncbi:MAG: DUF5678 domain-containing protein [Caldilineaceae bacterium]